jgi:alkylation response protein AidB-like acyl-CoA dehydrogenase
MVGSPAVDSPRPATSFSVDEVRRILAEHAERHDRDATFPSEGILAAGRAGLLGATAARRYGGAELGIAECARLLAELGQGDPSAALVICMTLLHHAFHTQALLAAAPDAPAIGATWPEEVYRRTLPDPGGPPILVNTLRVEPELGTPARGGLPATIARRTDEGWLLSGRKIYSTGSHALTWMAVFARTDEPVPRVGTFLVQNRPSLDGPPSPVSGVHHLAAEPAPGPASGIEVVPTWDHLGLRATASHDVVFSDVLVPSDAVLGLAEPGTGAAHSSAGPLAGWNLLLPALYLGVARAALEWLVEFLHTRTPSSLGAPLATLPRFHTAVGEIQARILTAEELILGLAGRIDNGDLEAVCRVGTVKAVAVRELIAAVQEAVALVGNPGLTRANPLQRHLRDILCSRVHTPQEDAVLLNLGRSVLAARGSATGAVR